MKTLAFHRGHSIVGVAETLVFSWRDDFGYHVMDIEHLAAQAFPEFSRQSIVFLSYNSYITPF